MQLTVSGREVEVDAEAIERLSTGTPEIRHWWTATTQDYQPVLLLELPGGLIVVPGSGAADEALALGWDEIATLAEDEPAWTLLITPVCATTLRLLFASVGELHRVAARLARRGIVAPSDPQTAARPEAVHPEPAVVGASVQRSNVGESDVEACGARCSGVTRVTHGARIRGRARGAHAANPTLDRIERRLATVETLLTDLAVAARPQAR